MSTVISLTEGDFAEVFGEMTDRVAAKIKETDLQYTELSREERDGCIRQIVKGLVNGEFSEVGEHRRDEWERGWSKNLAALRRGAEDSVIPYYFRHDSIARWKQEFVKPARPGFDRGGLSIIMEWLFEKYMKDAPAVYEFGCGTGHNLLQLQRINPNAKLCGLDWTKSSQMIIEEMVEAGQLRNSTARNFDFFKPDASFSLETGAVVYTVGALEQVGVRHRDFVKYLLEKKPILCVHVEPVAELLDPSNLLDYLAIAYFQKRDYLSGFLSGLRSLEQSGHINLHKAQRTYLGGNMYVDHYSVVVWSPR